MKARGIRTKTFTEATAAALDAAVLAWVEALGEENIVSIHFAHAAGTVACMIVYSD